MTRRRAGLVAVVCVGLAYATLIQATGWNQASHYALIRAIDSNTAHIDPYAGSTGDRARFNGHWFSARAPGLAFLSQPAYHVLEVTGATSNYRVKIGGRSNSLMVWALGIWAAAIPALLTMLLVWRVAERLEPGFGLPTAVTLGLGTLLLPFATMLFSHVLSACLGFAAFALLVGQRSDLEHSRLWRFALAGVCVGYGITTEYPLLFVGLILGVYAITAGDAVRRGAVYAAGVVLGVVPLALYNLWAFGSIAHVAYADIPRQQAGFFGIRVPDPSVAIQLLFSSRGLFTLAPVLLMGLVGAVMLHRRGQRAEAYVVAAIGLVFLAYNSGYFLPYGGRVPGPRFLITTLPFLAFPVAAAYRRYPGVTVALGAISIVAYGIATITQPLVSAEGDTGMWTNLLFHAHLQPTVLTIFKLHDEWLAMAPFFVAAVAALVLTVWAAPALVMSWRQAAAGAAATGAWALFAVLGPHALGIDRAAERMIVAAGDRTATWAVYGSHPLRDLALIAVAGALIALLAMRGVSAWRARSGEPSTTELSPVAQAA
ncbi:MAG: hypothetical protein QOK25_2110 [Thermoleophilaceae bacterium]|nr:hypothetical protein [Thermoleophilaceae bacterium]